MIVRLHKQARTTPAVRAEIQAYSGTNVELAARYNVSVLTIAKWRKRDSVEDGSHTAHRLQTTMLFNKQKQASGEHEIDRLCAG